MFLAVGNLKYHHGDHHPQRGGWGHCLHQFDKVLEVSARRRCLSSYFLPSKCGSFAKPLVAFRQPGSEPTSDYVWTGPGDRQSGFLPRSVRGPVANTGLPILPDGPRIPTIGRLAFECSVQCSDPYRTCGCSRLDYAADEVASSPIAMGLFKSFRGRSNHRSGRRPR
jgi:hypothetical protein